VDCQTDLDRHNHINSIIPEVPLNSETALAPGISGKKFTIALIGTMILVGGSLAYELAVYENLDRARAKSAEHWRTVALQLDNDYKQIEALDPPAEQLAADWLTRFRMDADQFRTATTMEEQLRQARNLESQLRSYQGPSADIPKMSDQLRKQIEDLNASLTAERAIQQSLAGKVVQFFIRHPIRENWEVTR
jgi:hypothetical protein